MGMLPILPFHEKKVSILEPGRPVLADNSLSIQPPLHGGRQTKEEECFVSRRPGPNRAKFLKTKKTAGGVCSPYGQSVIEIS
jgi:hypothetical protein